MSNDMTQEELNEALLAAARGCKPDEVVRLVELGAKPDVADEWVHDRQPLHYAAISGWREVVKLLVAKGVRVDVKDNNGDQPLHFAAANGSKDMVELLVARGAKVGAANGAGLWPLHCAVRNGREEVVKLLLEYGANPSVRDYDRLSPRGYCKNKRITALLDAAEREWERTLMDRLRKLAALRQKGPSL